MKTISFVLACYNEEKNIPLVVDRIKKVVDQLNKFELEIICIDDKSQDNTIGVLRELSSKLSYLRYVKLAKNVGSHMAIACGLQEAKGDAIIVLASDGQDPPEFTTNLINEWEQGTKIVWGARKSFKQSFLDGLFSSSYYWLMDKFSDANLHDSGADMVLLDRNVVDVFNEIEERNSSIWALICSLGYDQVTCYYDKQERIHGTSSWTFSKKWRAALDSFISFSSFPIRFVSIIGMFLSIISFIVAILYLINYFTHGLIFGEIETEGWLSILLSVLFFGGIQMLTLGLIGEYLIRVLNQVKKRPPFIIEERSNDISNTIK